MTLFPSGQGVGVGLSDDKSPVLRTLITSEFDNMIGGIASTIGLCAS